MGALKSPAGAMVLSWLWERVAFWRGRVLREEEDADPGVGAVQGVMEEWESGRRWALRTDPAFALLWARGYDPTLGGVIRERRDEGGESLFLVPGVPVYAPFRGRVEAVFPAARHEDRGMAVVLRSVEAPSVRLRLLHLEGAVPQVGAWVRRGERIGGMFGRWAFPGGERSRLRVEAIVSGPGVEEVFWAPANAEVFATVNAAWLVYPAVEERAAWAWVLAMVVAMIAALGTWLAR